MDDRDRVLARARLVAAGDRAALTFETRTAPGRCAQLVREVVSPALGLGQNGWPVAVKALEYAVANRSDRWAAHYERAARDLGLARAGGEPEPGDVLYWPYAGRDGRAYGHTAVYLGGGLCLENTDHRTRGERPYGRGPVRVTPLAAMGAPSTVAAVSREALELPEPPALPPKLEVVTLNLNGAEFPVEAARVVGSTLWVRTKRAPRKEPT